MSANSAITDEELVDIVRAHDKEKYSEIIKRYQNKLLRYVRYLLLDDEKAVDVVQETFVKAFINLNSFDTNKKFSSWIYRISHNEAMNLVKKTAREVPIDPTFDVAGKQNIEEEFDKKELLAIVHDCIEQLPIIYAEPLILYSLHEKTYEEVSDILRLPMGTVATRIRRAKLVLKSICQKKM